MIRNHTIRRPLTPEEIQAREQWLSEQRVAADLLNEQLMTAQSQIQVADFQNRLVEATMLSLPQLLAIKAWLEAR